MKFKIYYGIDAVDEDDPKEIMSFKNREAAMDYAYEQALSELESYGGLHGYPDPDDEDFDQEAESFLYYDAKSITDEEAEKLKKDLNL